MKSITRVLALILVLGGMTAMLGACDNTIRGIGQDIKDTGDAVKDSTS